jgi:hypothetical protein
MKRWWLLTALPFLVDPKDSRKLMIDWQRPGG